MKQSDVYHLVSQKDLRRLDTAICHLTALIAAILGPEHKRLRVKQGRLKDPHWWPKRDPPMQPESDLLDVF